MSEPIAFISHFRVREGAAEPLRRLSAQIVAELEAQKPQTLVFLSYLDDERGQVSFVHVFGDAEAMNRHLEGADERSASAYELIEPLGWEIYGRPSDSALNSMRAAAQSTGVSLTLQPIFAGGFVRLS